MLQAFFNLKFLYLLLGITIPFATLGPALPGMIWIAPGLLIGAAILAVSTLLHGINYRMLVGVAMLLVLTATSLARHAPSTYALSLIAFAVSMAPLFITRVSDDSHEKLITGFIIGYLITLFLIFFWIVTQLVNMRDLYESLSPFRRVRLNNHNYFVAYYRPQAGFAEPAHLAYYLAFSYAVFDHLKVKWANFLKLSCAIAIFAIGSLVGIVLFATYFLLKTITHLPKFRLSKRVLTRSILGAGASVAVLVTVVPTSFLMSMYEVVTSRFSKAFDAAQSGRMSGSEGSRVNTLRALFDYWGDQGYAGMLYGEGYGNISAWLSEFYAGIRWSTMAAGGVDSKFVALAISSGLVGIIFYVSLFFIIFRHFGGSRNLAIIALFIVANLASGGLLVYWKWHLLFVLLLVAQRNHASAYEAENFRTVRAGQGYLRGA